MKTIKKSIICTAITLIITITCICSIKIWHNKTYGNYTQKSFEIVQVIGTKAILTDNSSSNPQFISADLSKIVTKSNTIPIYISSNNKSIWKFPEKIPVVIECCFWIALGSAILFCFTFAYASIGIYSMATKKL